MGQFYRFTFLFVFLSVCMCLSLEKVFAMDDHDLQVATFGGGCFWCMQPPFDNEPGVKKTEVGYMGGFIDKPSYRQVSTGETGHTEVVQVYYNPEEISYRELLNIFWRNIDPTAYQRQFSDVGSQYRTAIFYRTQAEKHLAEETKQELEDSNKFRYSIATEIIPISVFYPAEGYHQDYYKKNPTHYKRYSYGSGRAPFLQKAWGDQNNS